MHEKFFSLDKKDQLDEIILRLYDMTFPAGGMDDYIFFEKSDAINHLNESFSDIDLNDPGNTSEKEIYDQIRLYIDDMRYFISFKADNIETFFVDDYSRYGLDLLKQISENIKYTEMEMNGDY